MSENRRYVLLALLLTAVLMGLGLTGLIQTVYGWVDFIDPPILGNRIRTAHLAGYLAPLLTAFYFYKDKHSSEWLEEVVRELRLTKWPSKDDIKANTIVTILLTFALAAIFYIYDAVWSFLTARIY